MNTTDTATSAAKPAATATPAKASKSQRRMARPALDDAGSASSPAVTSSTDPRAPARATGSKTTAVIALLERDKGATLAELVAATGWLAHTTRAALTGLRKKGHGIERSKRGEETFYRIIKAG